MIRAMIIFVVIVMSSCCFSEENALLTNVYLKSSQVYQNHYLNGRLRSPERYFRCVRGGGVDFELDGIHLERFMDLVKVVSNNCPQIASDWYSYETNEMVRFTTLSAVGYSGYNNYTNFVRLILDYKDQVQTTNLWRTVHFIADPYGTPMEFQLALNYENPMISNQIVRIKSYAILNDATNSVNWATKVLSGEWKRNYLQMEAAGAL